MPSDSARSAIQPQMPHASITSSAGFASISRRPRPFIVLRRLTPWRSSGLRRDTVLPGESPGLPTSACGHRSREEQPVAVLHRRESRRGNRLLMLEPLPAKDKSKAASHLWRDRNWSDAVKRLAKLVQSEDRRGRMVRGHVWRRLLPRARVPRRPPVGMTRRRTGPRPRSAYCSSNGRRRGRGQ